MDDKNKSVKTVWRRKDISSADVPEEGEGTCLGHRELGRIF